MAIIDCPECTHKISDQSVSCTNCGFPTSKITSLIECPECSESISNQSVSCTNCGFPIARSGSLSNSVPPPLPRENIVANEVQTSQPHKGHKQASFTQVIIVLVAASIFFYFFIGSDQNETLLATAADQITETPAEATIEIETTAEKMVDAYEANEVNADNVFKDRVIKIVGIVDSIDSNFSDDAVVRLSSGDEYSFNTVRTSGDAEFHNQAITLNKGNKVTLICIGDGEVIGSPLLTDCRFS